MRVGGTAPAARIPMVDIARLYGIALVYYGHVVERMMYLGDPAAAAQYKFIYSFHMTLFFVLAGFISKPSLYESRPAVFLKDRWTSRLVPFLFFNAVLAGLALVAPRDFPPIDLSGPAAFGMGVARTLVDLPVFNIPTWFLMCLVSVEFIHYAAFRALRQSDARILAAIPVFYLAGYTLNRVVDPFNAGQPFSGNVWFVHEAVAMYAFYLLGVLMRRRRFLMGPVPAWILAGGAVAALAFVTFTYGLNQGPFRLIQAVVVLAGGHGNIFWFPVTAVAGSLAVLLLARLTPPAPFLTYLGSNVLVLFCLNGVFYHSLNGPVAAWAMAAFPGSPWAAFGVGVTMTAASLALCLPVVRLLNAHLPWALGKGSAHRAEITA